MTGLQSGAKTPRSTAEVVVTINGGLDSALLPTASDAEPSSASSTSSSTDISSASFDSSTSELPAYVEPSTLPRRLTVQQVRDCAAAFKPLKPLNFSLLRWSLLWLALVLGVIGLPVYIAPLTSVRVAFLVACSGLLLNVFVWVVCLLLCCWTLWRVCVGQRTDFVSLYPPSFPLFHLLVLTIYKDDMEVVERTLESVAAQTEAKRVVVNIAWESRTPDVEARTRRIQERFEGKVALLHFTVHPYGLPHEIASKAANANYGLRNTVLRVLQQGGETDVSHFMVSTQSYAHALGRTPAPPNPPYPCRPHIPACTLTQTHKTT